MGRFFTYRLTIRDDHQLITGGVYSVVRHPGYLGTFLGRLGGIVACLSQGSWVRECGILDTKIGKCAIYGGLFLSSAIYLLVASRMGKEDAALRRQFGKEWDNWARRVPYKLIPWVY